MKVFKSTLKRMFLRVAPETASSMIAARDRAHSQRVVKQWGLFEINRKLMKELGTTVVSGPFRGIKLTPMTWHEHIGPYLLGTYETELHPCWEKVFQHEQSFDRIIDIGAKFGYYAVGLALRFPRSTVVAFDTDRWARQATSEMAAANQVRNLVLKSRCTPARLREHLGRRSFILSDCEGYEDELFSQIDPTDLSTAVLLIELHEQNSPGVTSRIQSRFAPTHVATTLNSLPAAILPTTIRIVSLNEEEVRRASKEVRSPQAWLFLTPRQ
jgi:hypothetical protein